MFMVKNEYENAKKLLRIKLRDSKRGLIILFATIAFIQIISLVSSALYVAEGNWDITTSISTADPLTTIATNISPTGVKHLSVMDYSAAFIMGLVIVHFISAVSFRKTNDFLSIFPQSNCSRFITSQIMDYVNTIIFGVCSLLMYLVSYGVLYWIARKYDNVYFALNFDFGFLIIGLLIFIAYNFLFVAFFGLVGAIIRKWTYCAVAVFVVVISLIFVNFRFIADDLAKIFLFLSDESSIIMFFIKAIALWLAVTAAAFIINYRTVYYKDAKKPRKLNILIVCAVIVAIIMGNILVAMTFFTASSATNIMTFNSTENDPLSNFSEIRIDVSHLPRGTKLDLVSSNVIFQEAGNFFTSQSLGFGFGAEELNNIQGDTISIRYRFSRSWVNGIEIDNYGNPKLTAYLEGTTLYIDYTAENALVIFLPIWGMSINFDYFKEMGVVQGTAFGHVSGRSSSGTQVNIQVE